MTLHSHGTGLNDLPGVTVVPPQSNILFVDLAPQKAAGAVQRLRLVTHLDVSAADIRRAVTLIRATL